MARSEKKKNSKKNIFYNIIIIILIGVIAVCAFKLGKIYYDYYMGTKAYNKVTEEVQKKEKGVLTIDWQKLLEKNKDVKAWLYLDKSAINYPVLQGVNNDQYLRNMLNGDYDIKGSIFVDSRTKRPFDDLLTVVYGHHMQDDTMFTDVANYFTKEGFYKEHKNFLLLLPSGNNYKLEVVAGAQINDDSPFYKFQFYSPEEKQNYINQMIGSNQVSGLDSSKSNVTIDDKLVMMSTCADFSGGESRYVLWCKMVPAEKSDLKVVEEK